MKKELIILIMLGLIGALIYGGITGMVIEENTTATNISMINETLRNVTINETLSNNTSVNETILNNTDINESEEDYDVEIIYDLSNQSLVPENISNALEYCASKDLKCQALGLFYNEGCDNGGLCSFDDIEDSSLSFYNCNTTLYPENYSEFAKLVICKGKKIQESEVNSISAYSIPDFKELEGIKNANDFCKSLDLKCKAVEWFYRDDCKNGWCDFDDLGGSIIKLLGCGTANNPDKKGAASVILCSGKKENIKEKNCEDLDGMNYSVKGNSSKNNHYKTDSCKGDILTEYFCEENKLMKAEINCTYGCEEGTCLPYIPPICTDIDEDGYFSEGGECGPMDCNDNNLSINPNMTEMCGSLSGYDGIDNDCDGNIDLDCEAHCDLDGDGYSPSIKFYCALIGKSLGECDDEQADINPGMNDSSCDGIDNDCDGNIDQDCVLPLNSTVLISESEIVDLETETQIGGGSSSGGGSSGGGGGGSTRPDAENLPELRINEEERVLKELPIKNINEEQIRFKEKLWFEGILSILFLLIIITVYYKLMIEVEKNQEKKKK